MRTPDVADQTHPESYLPQRFWREGWIFNKTLQMLECEKVQILESELVLTHFCKAVSH